MSKNTNCHASVTPTAEVKLRMVYGGRSRLADIVEDEVHRQNLQDAPYSCEGEDNLSESQVCSLSFKIGELESACGAGGCQLSRRLSHCGIT
jgi:hypothetical protein